MNWRTFAQAAAFIVVVLLLTMVVGQAEPQDDGTASIAVDATKVINPRTGNALGITSNYWWDAQANRAAGSRSFEDALRDLDVEFIRYPGGEKSDGHLWAAPPYERPSPRLARISAIDWPSNDPAYWAPPGDPAGAWAHPIYDFDQFMTDCNAVRCEPVIVVAADGIHKSPAPGGTALTQAQAVEAAAAWVHYANIVKGYGVRYWEIGNESWSDSYMGTSAGAARYGKDVVAFSQAMKAVDPSIKIGANGNSSPWFNTVLREAASDIDFLAVHSYPAHGRTFEDYVQHRLPTSLVIDDAASALAGFTDHRDRIFIALTEVGDLGEPNSLGRALINFDSLGQYLADPRIQFSIMWTTRWIPGSSPASSDALDSANGLLPMGRSLAIWGQFGRGSMVDVSSDNRFIGAYAIVESQGAVPTLLLVNRSSSVVSASIAVRGANTSGRLDQWVMTGSGPADLEPTFARTGDVEVVDGRTDVPLAPYSVTVLVSSGPR